MDSINQNQGRQENKERSAGQKKTAKRVGIFGGAFDPPHMGHIRLAELCCERLGLEELLIVPTYRSPHKPNSFADYEDRLAMCRLAFAKKKCTVSDIERELGGEGYSIDMVRAVKQEYPNGAKIFMIIGGDMLFSFNKWYRYESILKECNVVAAAREEDSYADMTECASELGHVKVLNLPVTEVSSTEVRQSLKEKVDIEGLLSNEVAEYIMARGLYL